MKAEEKIHMKTRDVISCLQLNSHACGMSTVINSCFCCKLKTGGIIIGWVDIVLSLVIGFALIGALAFASKDVSALLNHFLKHQDASQFPVTSK